MRKVEMKMSLPVVHFSWFAMRKTRSCCSGKHINQWLRGHIIHWKTVGGAKLNWEINNQNLISFAKLLCWRLVQWILRIVDGRVVPVANLDYNPISNCIYMGVRSPGYFDQLSLRFQFNSFLQQCRTLSTTFASGQVTWERRQSE